MIQQGQVLELKRASREHGPLWAYRYRVGGRVSRRVQRGGFASEEDAVAALERELERIRRERRVSRNLTLSGQAPVLPLVRAHVQSSQRGTVLVTASRTSLAISPGRWLRVKCPASEILTMLT
jgi:hypothetical protein